MGKNLSTAEKRLDEIDVLRQAFDSTRAEAWHVIGRKFWGIIDLATTPILSPEQEHQLDFLRLNEQADRPMIKQYLRSPTLERHLGRYGLVEAYEDIMTQVQNCQPSIFTDDSCRIDYSTPQQQ